MADIRVHKDEYRRRAEAFAASIGADPGSPIEWKDPVRLSALGLGVLRGAPIRLEIEERRERIRRAAALAKILAHAAGDELIEVTHPRPKTVAGIAVLRALRIQLGERSSLTEKVPEHPWPEGTIVEYVGRKAQVDYYLEADEEGPACYDLVEPGDGCVPIARQVEVPAEKITWIRGSAL